MNGEREEKNACPTAIPSAAPLLELHWSQVSMLQRCPAQYEFRYIKGIKRPPGIAAHVGSGVHKSAEANLTAKLENPDCTLAREDAADIARDTVNRRIETDGVLLSEDEAKRGMASVKGEAVDKAVRLAMLHYDVLAPTIEPVGIEIPWTVNVTGTGISLAGRIDLEVVDGLRDLKTTGKTPPADSADKADQLSMYATAYRVLRGKMPAVLALDYLVDNATPKSVTLSTIRDEKDIEIFLRRISTALRVIETGAFMPCSRDSWVCSKRFCGYYGECLYVR